MKFRDVPLATTEAIEVPAAAAAVTGVMAVPPKVNEIGSAVVLPSVSLKTNENWVPVESIVLPPAAIVGAAAFAGTALMP